MNRCRGVINSAYLEISCLHRRKKKIRESFRGFFLCHKRHKRAFKESLALLDLTTFLTYHIIVLVETNHQHLQNPMLLRLFKQAKDSH